MGFGIDTGISRNTTNTVQVAEKVDEDGVISEMTPYGGVAEITEEVYEDAGSFTNLATNTQTAGTSLVTSHGLIESNTEYCRATKTTRTALAGS